MLALSTPAYLALAALSLFGALVIVRYVLALGRHAGSLARSIARANESVQMAAADLGAEVADAREAVERISERTRRIRRGSGSRSRS